MRKAPDNHHGHRGFSLLELVVVAGICAVFFTTGAIAYRSIAQNQRRVGTFQEVNLSSAVAANFFPGSSGTVVDSYTAPNFGRAQIADGMRELFLEDVEKSVAVFCLPRADNINSIRQRTLALAGRLPQQMDTPAEFFTYLRAVPSTATPALVFTSYRGAPPDAVTARTTTRFVTNGSIMLLQPSGANTELWLRAVYEIDYIAFNDNTGATQVPCVYATVRRYVNGTLTNYYDVVYRDAQLSQIGVPFVHFENAARSQVTETSSIERFKLARNQPFYLIWWPDPAVSRPVGTADAATYASTAPQAAYAKHEGQTSYFFAVPQFPAF